MVADADVAVCCLRVWVSADRSRPPRCFFTDSDGKVSAGGPDGPSRVGRSPQVVQGASHRFQLGARYVGVDLGGTGAAVAEQLLDEP